MQQALPTQSWHLHTPEFFALADEVLLRKENPSPIVRDDPPDPMRVEPMCRERLLDGAEYLEVVGHDQAEADPHVENSVHLGVRDTSEILDEPEDRLRVGKGVEPESNRRLDTRQVEETVAGDVDQRPNRHALRLKKIHHWANVYVRRPKELLANRAAKLRHVLTGFESTDLEQSLPGQRQTVAVDTAAADADDDVSGRHMLPKDDPVQWNDRGAHAYKIEAAAGLVSLDDVRDLRDLPTDDTDTGQLSASVQPVCNLLKNFRRGSFESDVVEKGDRLGANADRVIDVHRDAVNADGVVAAKHFGDQDFATDPVRAEGEPKRVRDFDNAGEESDIDHSSSLAGGAERCGRAHPLQERRQEFVIRLPIRLFTHDESRS